MGACVIRHAIKLLLETDSVDWAKTVQQNLSRQRNCEVSLSETVDYVLQLHWKKTLKRMMDQRHVERFGEGLKGSKLIRPKVRA